MAGLAENTRRRQHIPDVSRNSNARIPLTEGSPGGSMKIILHQRYLVSLRIGATGETKRWRGFKIDWRNMR